LPDQSYPGYRNTPQNTSPPRSAGHGEKDGTSRKCTKNDANSPTHIVCLGISHDHPAVVLGIPHFHRLGEIARPELEVWIVVKGYTGEYAGEIGDVVIVVGGDRQPFSDRISNGFYS